MYYYVYPPTLNMDYPNVLEANNCFRLGTEDARLNAQSYVFYATNEFPLRNEDEWVWKDR